MEEYLRSLGAENCGEVVEDIETDGKA